jgi:hypothetical protein
VTALDLPAGQSARNHADRLAVGERIPPSAGLADAGDSCRPVFPWRPVALVLATEVDANGWTDAVALVDELQDLDVDARLALPAEPTATSRTVRPARASEATLRALRPDVVVAWDPGAVAAAEGWAIGLRALTIVERVDDGPVRTVDWRIGHTTGRVRGRFGPSATAADLAPLIRRLPGGPQPEAPDPEVVIGRNRRAWDRVDPTIGVHRSPVARSCVYVAGTPSPLVDHLRRANVHVELVRPEAVTAAMGGAELVVLRGVSDHPGVRELAASRAGRATVLRLDEADLDGGGLSAGARALLDRCGLGIAPTAAGTALLHEAGARAITVPRVMPADRYEELSTADLDVRPSLVVIGWSPGDGTAPEDRAVEEAFRTILDARDDARVDLVRGGDLLAGLPSVRRLRHDPEPHSTTRWTVCVSSARSVPPLHREPALLAEAAVLGVPSLVALGAIARPGQVRVAQPDDAGSWIAAIEEIVDDAALHARLAFEGRAAAASLHRPAAADAVVNRFLGWIDRTRR